jgi:hypothetical protein
MENQIERNEASESATAAAERVRQIRARLPGQVRRERIETARALYGTLYGLTELQQKIGQTMTPRWGQRRTARLEPIESYEDAIPDEALLKFDDAQRTGLFTAFHVATPAYTKGQEVDPWLVGQLTDCSLYAVIAQWT